jgi:6-phosphogluconolactonase (cycloisomerase 2 family)
MTRQSIPKGKFAYVSNFGSDNVSAYTINATSGALIV